MAKEPTTEARYESVNCVRPHGAFDISKLETPIKVFYQRMPQKEVLMNPSLLTGEEMIS